MDAIQSFIHGFDAYVSYYILILVLVMVILTVAVIVLLYRQRELQHELDFFMQGPDGQDIETALRKALDDNTKVKVLVKKNIDEIQHLKGDLRSAYRKTGVVKFNAFPGMAGKVSSSIALLNNEDNGFIITTIHGQEGCYTYVKEIMNGKSVNPLMKEDEEALKIALGNQL
ncbi:MAG: DUF4446 family protein [Lachnospiraceae bacterium]|nr:DUF4446 family protein [Lachnospiraceae bacterium]